MTRIPVHDVDLHHSWASDESLAEYMPSEWKQYFNGSGEFAPFPGYGRSHPAHVRYPVVTGSGMRPGTIPPDGGRPGSHYETMREQHLDPHDVAHALLTWQYGLHPGLHNANAAVALCQAANDFMADYWLGRDDDRLRGAISVPVASPQDSVREIERWAGNPRIAAVLVAVNPFAKPLGHPVYRPILKAAADHSLAVVAHLGSDSISKATWTAGGLSGTMVEYYTTLQQPGLHHLSSLISGDTFEEIPNLKILINEYGFTWVPEVVWGLDARYRELKVEMPAMKRLPSEYFRDHIWLATQPFVGEGDTKTMIRLLETFEGIEDSLCYASDYPHWDFDSPEDVIPRLPRGWRAKVAYENACRLFGWAPPELAEPPVEGAGVRSGAGGR